MPEPWTATITAMPASSNERTRVFPVAPGGTQPAPGTGRPTGELLGVRICRK